MQCRVLLASRGPASSCKQGRVCKGLAAGTQTRPKDPGGTARLDLDQHLMGKPGGHYREPACGTVLVPDIARGMGPDCSVKHLEERIGSRVGLGRSPERCAA